jgi:MFS family permease
VRALLSDRRVLLFYAASAVSALGDDALYLALAVWVKELTGSTSLAALDICAVAAGMLFAPVTGILVDRVRRLPLLTWTYLASAALVLSLLAVAGRGQVWLIITVTFLYGLSGTVSTGALGALVQKIVPAELLAEANGIEQTLLQGMSLVTPAAGVGLLAWLGGHAVALMDAATFLIAVALLAFLRVQEHPAAKADRKRWIRDLGTGFARVAHTTALRQLTAAYVPAFLVFGISVPLMLQVVTVGLHHRASWLAVVTTVEGVGGAIGGLCAGRAARRAGDRLLMAGALCALALLIAAFAVPSDGVVLTAMACFGFFIAWFFVGGTTARQKHTPNELMGRVYGAISMAFQAAQAAGNAIGAALVLLLSYRNMAYLCAAILALTALYLGTRRAWHLAPERTPNLAKKTHTGSAIASGNQYPHIVALAGAVRAAADPGGVRVVDGAGNLDCAQTGILAAGLLHDLISRAGAATAPLAAPAVTDSPGGLSCTP